MDLLPFLDKYNQTRHLFTLYKHFNYYFKYRDTVLYCDMFGSDMQYYYLVLSHIPNGNCSISSELLGPVLSPQMGL